MKKEAWSPRVPKSKPKPILPGQPDWEFIANLGDANPLTYGGYFVYRDRTGKYGEEAELLVVDEGRGGRYVYSVYRFGVDQLKLVDGYLVSPAYTPDWPYPIEKHDAWFHEKLGDVAEHIGVTKEELEKAFISTNPLARAEAYRAVGDYHGWENLDAYPLTNLSRAVVEKRYPEVARRGPE
jgi:hypothetical protein